MRPTSWLRSWKTRITRRTAPIKRPARRPRLERLEDRHVPAPVVAVGLSPSPGPDPNFGTAGVATIPSAGDVVIGPTQLTNGRIVAPFTTNGVVSGFR